MSGSVRTKSWDNSLEAGVGMVAGGWEEGKWRVTGDRCGWVGFLPGVTETSYRCWWWWMGDSAGELKNSELRALNGWLLRQGHVAIPRKSGRHAPFPVHWADRGESNGLRADPAGCGRREWPSLPIHGV